MAVNLSPVGGVAAQFFTNNGTPLSGGKLYTYAAGTTTPQATYTTAGGGTAHTNPIVLDSAGRVPNGGEIWLTDGLQYKFLLKDSNDVLIATYDNITGINSNFVNYTNQQEIQTATSGQTVFTLATMTYQPGTGSLSVFVDGVNQYGPGALYSFQETSSTSVTFNTGLHVGASVKFTTSAINASSYGNASQISYTPAGTGAVATNVQAKLRQTVSVMDFGAVGDGVTDDTAAIQLALNTGKSVVFPQGSYKAANLTIATNFQRLIANGDVKIIKNANGPIITVTASDVEFNGIGFRGDASTPTFTGDNVVASGANFRMLNCGSRWAAGRAVKSTGSHTQILGTCDLYQTADATATGYDIELGVSGTATLYHQITNIYTSQSTGGILTTDTGSLMVSGSQFGKLTVNAGTSPSGVNGGQYSTNRIVGNISVNVSNSAFAANECAGSTITFGAGTSGHFFDTSNTVQVGTTITNNASASLVVDSRVATPTLYTPVWTAASVNPSLGDGTLTGQFAKTGQRVDFTLALSIGSTTTLGAGVWYFTLPYVPSTTFQWQTSGYCVVSGVAFYVLTGVSLTDGTGRMLLVSNNGSNNVGPAIPAAWTVGSTLYISGTYYSQS